MPEQAYTPPETKYEVHIDELMKAIKGEDFVQGNGLYRMKGDEIDRKSLLEDGVFYFDGAGEYVILTEATLIPIDAIVLTNDAPTNYGIGFIFYKSILPNIEIKNTETAVWQLYHSQLGDINIRYNSQIGGIDIKYSQTSNILIDYSQTSDITIYNSQIGGIFIDQGGLTDYIWIRGNSQTGYITFHNNSQTGSIWIEGSQTGDIWIDDSQVNNLSTENAELSDIKIDNNCLSIWLYNTSLLRMTLEQCLLTQFEWGAGTKGEVYISQSRMMHLQMATTSLPKDSVLSLSDTEVQYFALEKIQMQGSLLLRKVWAAAEPFAWLDVDEYLGAKPEGDEWELKRWESKKKLLKEQQQEYINKVAEVAKQYGPTPIFRISHSSLGKTEITGCDFSGFQFQYYNSNLLGCFITGTKLPKRNMVIYDPVTDTVLNNQSHSHALFEQKTAVYNQFKKIYENQGDVVEASVFHAQAMHWQQKLLWRQFRHDKEGFWKKVKLFFENIGFRLNWFSNNHGESWLVALVFTIGVGLLFFTASIWGLTHWGDGKTWYDNIHKLPGFMLPTHSYDYLSKDIIETTKTIYPHLKVNLWHTLWDFMGRIFVGYGIFQFISAFRRHGKKGG